jgi:hypothetical protein
MNIQLTKNNHFYYSYNNKKFSFREAATDQFSTMCGSISRPVKCWHDECLIAAQEIYERARGKVTILFSGGMDSEVVVRSFIKIGAPIEVVTIRFKNYLNHYDLGYAQRSSQNLGIQLKYLDLDVQEFWKTKAIDYALSVQVSSPQFPVLFWASDQIDNYLVLGSGEPFVSRKEGQNIFYDVESEIKCSLYRWFIYRNRESAPCFFQYTPEQILSFLIDDKFCQFLKSAKERRILSTKKVKHELYSQHFDLEYRTPMTGYELLDESEKKMRIELQRIIPSANAECWTPLEAYLSYLRRSI